VTAGTIERAQAATAPPPPAAVAHLRPGAGFAAAHTFGSITALAGGLALAVSAHAPAEVAAVRAAAGDRVAFALLGPIHDTPSKRAFGAPLGTAAITAAARTGLPVVAVGGVGPGQVRDALAAGASGVACIRAVMAAPDPFLAVETFCKELNASAG